MFEHKSSNTTLDTFKGTSMQDHFIALAEIKFYEVNTWYLAGMSLNNNRIIAWFNWIMFDPSAVSLNLVHNAMAKAVLGIDHSIQVIDFPLPIRDYARINYQRFQDMMYIDPMVLILSTAISISSSFYIIFHIRDRVSNAKLLQSISGLNMCIFWMASFLFDFLTYMVIILTIVTILAFTQGKFWSAPADLGPLNVILLAYGFSTLPMTYIASFLFSKPSIGFMCIAAITILTSNIIFEVRIYLLYLCISFFLQTLFSQ